MINSQQSQRTSSDFANIYHLNMDLQYCILAAFCVFGMACGQACEDGTVQGEGCRSYQRCDGGVWVQIDCAYPDEAYDFETQQCVPYADAAPPCDQVVDCLGLDDGSYPDVELGCEWFYSCMDSEYKGHQTCAPGLVFHFGMQICNWPYNVGPPCGTCGTCAP